MAAPHGTDAPPPHGGPSPPHGGPSPQHDNHSAHHLHEFGDIDNVVHVPHDHHEAHAHDDPVTPLAVKTKLARKHRWSRLRASLLQERHLMQYFYSDTLYRAKEPRKVCREELFLDLVIVAAIAALGHELRASPISWTTVEKFMLLFAAVYSAWRQVVMLWNWWGVKEDVLEKAGIYLSFVCITGIALGAHEAFSDRVRPYVAISAFLATMIPTVGTVALASSEPLLNSGKTRVNQAYVFALSAVIAVLPYFASAFVGTKNATRVLYWVAFGLQFSAIHMQYWFFMLLHRNIEGLMRIAVNIELMVEKFEVLTMIVLGESVIGILFEAGAVVSKEGARIGMMYLSAIGSTAILYSLQTYYIQIDGPILKGGQHAIRYKAVAGLWWSTFHMLYHMCLILFATGVGFGLRDIVVPPKGKGAAEEAAHFLIDAAVRAGGEGSTIGKEQQFTRAARWVYTVGWGGSLLFSGAFAALHHGGVRAATKRLRLGLRAPIVIVLMVGMPFANISAGAFQSVFVAATAGMSLLEFMLVHMDRIGFFRSENSSGAGSSLDSAPLKTSDEGELFVTDGSEDDEEDGPAQDVESGTVNPAAVADANDHIARQLRARLCKGHCTRMEVVRPKRKKLVKGAKEEGATSGGKEAGESTGQEASLD